jgi:hypothetical protein
MEEASMTTSMAWTSWRAHFERNRTRPVPPLALPLQAGELGGAAASDLAWSLARFQIGETAEGRIVRQIARRPPRGTDADYARALELFVKEEGRHARLLAAMVKGLGGELVTATWTKHLFVVCRRLAGVHFKLVVLLVAEVIGIGFYGVVARRLAPHANLRQLRTALGQIVEDERAHLAFHRDFFRATAPRGWRRLLFRAAFTAVGAAAAVVFLIDHRRTLRSLGVGVGAMARALVALVREGQRLQPSPERAHAAAARSPSVPARLGDVGR